MRERLWLAIETGAEYQFLGGKAVIDVHLANHAGLPVPVVARVRVVRPGKSLLQGQCVRIRLDPLRPRGQREGHVLQVRPFKRARYGFRQEVAPQRAGFAVEHHQRVHDELAGHAEVQHLAVHLSGVPDSSEAEGSPGDRDRLPSHHVVHDLMPAEQRHGVRPCVAVDLNPEHKLLLVVLITRLFGRQERRVGYGRNCVGRQESNDLVFRLSGWFGRWCARTRSRARTDRRRCG